jgi:hypothetical protein
MICVWVDRILSASYVVCGVVKPHNVVSVNTVAFEMDAIKFSSAIIPRARGCNDIVVDWHLTIQHDFYTRQDMPFQFRPEVLSED